MLHPRFHWLAAVVVSAAMFSATGCGVDPSPQGEVNEALIDQRPGGVENLTKLLTMEQKGIRLDAVTRLGNLGPAAASAAAKIEQMASADQDEEVRKAAAEALAKIKAK